MQRVDSVSEREQDSTSGDRKRNAIKGWVKPQWLLSAGALALLVGALGASQFSPPANCKVDQPVARGTDAIINVTVRSGGACTVKIRPAALAASTLHLKTPPKNGALRRRGNTGVIYRIGRDFKGRDNFSFSIAREPSGRADPAIYHVAVNVL